MRRLLFIAWPFMLAICLQMPAAVWSSSTSSIAKGKTIYRDNCTACHGSSERGDGYVQFEPPVADLTSPTVQRKSDDELSKTVHAGRLGTAMGSWRLALSAEEIRDVVAYLRTLKAG